MSLKNLTMDQLRARIASVSLELKALELQPRKNFLKISGAKIRKGNLVAEMMRRQGAVVVQGQATSKGASQGIQAQAAFLTNQSKPSFEPSAISVQESIKVQPSAIRTVNSSPTMSAQILLPSNVVKIHPSMPSFDQPQFQPNDITTMIPDGFDPAAPMENDPVTEGNKVGEFIEDNLTLIGVGVLVSLLLLKPKKKKSNPKRRKKAKKKSRSNRRRSGYHRH
jgi:hypothetical protein